MLLNDKTRADDVLKILQRLKAEGVHAKLLYSRMGNVVADDGSVLPVAGTFAGAPSLTVDGVIVPGGDLSQLVNNGDALYYLLEAYKHLKPITLLGDARQFSTVLQVAPQGEEGVVQADDAAGSSMDDFLGLLRAHRIWSRISKIASIPA